MSQFRDSKTKFKFAIENIAKNNFLVVSFKGTEGLSKVYNFEILIATKLKINFDENSSQGTNINDNIVNILDILTAKACLSLENNAGKTHKINGIITSINEHSYHNGFTFYKLNLRPYLWFATQITKNAIILDKGTDEILKAAMQFNRLAKQKSQFKLTNSYEKQEFNMLYNECAYDYLAYKMERDGIYYYFDYANYATNNQENSEVDDVTMIFVDDKLSHTNLANNNLKYKQKSGLLNLHEDELINNFSYSYTQLPYSIFVRDYDWLKPNEPVMAEFIVSQNGVGEEYFYGDGFTTKVEGERLARIRAEGLKSNNCYYSGSSNIMGLVSGYVFKLSEHYNENYNKEYLITEIMHEGNQEALIASVLGIDVDNAKLFYRNEFKCIPQSQQYRTKRTLERKKIQGVLNAFIDASSEQNSSELDNYGRYKVVFPSDISGRDSGNASCWLRRSKEFAGADYGMSFPLAPGTEVIVNFFEGNPDRPLIAGVVNNAEVGSLEQGVNNKASVIKAQSGGQFTLGTTDGSKSYTVLDNGTNGSATATIETSVGDSRIDLNQWGWDYSSLASSSYASLSKDNASGLSQSLSTDGDFDIKSKPTIFKTFIKILKPLMQAGRSLAQKDEKRLDEQIAFDAALAALDIANLGMSIESAVNAKKVSYATQMTSSGYTNKLAMKSPMSNASLVVASIIAGLDFAAILPSGGATEDKKLKTLEKSLDKEVDKQLKKAKNGEVLTAEDEEFNKTLLKLKDDKMNIAKKKAVSSGVTSAITKILTSVVPIITFHKMNNTKPEDLSGISINTPERNIVIGAGIDAHINSDIQIVLQSGSLSVLKASKSNKTELKEAYVQHNLIESNLDRTIIEAEQVRTLGLKNSKNYALDTMQVHGLKNVKISNRHDDLTSAIEVAKDSINSRAEVFPSSLDGLNIETANLYTRSYANLGNRLAEISAVTAVPRQTYSSIDMEEGKLAIENNGEKLSIKQNATSANSKLELIREKNNINSKLEFNNQTNKLSFTKESESSNILMKEKEISCTVKSKEKQTRLVLALNIATLVQDKVQLIMNNDKIRMKAKDVINDASSSFMVNSDNIGLGSNSFKKSSIDLKASGSISLKGQMIKLG